MIDEDEEDDEYHVELMASDLEQMQSLLEFKVNRHRRAQPFAVMIFFPHALVCFQRSNISRMKTSNAKRNPLDLAAV